MARLAAARGDAPASKRDEHPLSSLGALLRHVDHQVERSWER